MFAFTEFENSFLAFRYERSTEHSIQLLLMVERNACNVDSLKPFLYFFLGMFALAFTNIDQ